MRQQVKWKLTQLKRRGVLEAVNKHHETPVIVLSGGYAVLGGQVVFLPCPGSWLWHLTETFGVLLGT